LQFGGLRGHAVDNPADAGFELGGEVEHRLAAVFLGALLVRFLLGA